MGVDPGFSTFHLRKDLFLRSRAAVHLELTNELARIDEYLHIERPNRRRTKSGGQSKLVIMARFEFSCMEIQLTTTDFQSCAKMPLCRVAGETIG